jgi:VWFA-related protein
LAFLFPSCLAAQQQPPPSASNPGAVIKTNVNEVLVSVVVRDAQGHTVGNLTKDNFQVLDNGKPQVLTGFVVVKRADATTGATPSAPSPNSTAAAPQPPSPAQRFVVFLFDDLNLSISDLAQSQNAANTVLEESLSPSDMAAVLSTSGTNSGLTLDHAKLRKAIQDLRINSIYRHDSHDCPNVDYYQGDLLVEKNDPMALQAAVQDYDVRQPGSCYGLCGHPDGRISRAPCCACGRAEFSY